MARIKLLSVEQRHDAGKALRVKCPRSSHGKVILGQGDKRDIVKLIEAANKDRVENLIPIRHGRMLQSPFAYFRGTAGVQAYDLAGTPTSGIIVQTCGDCHLVNFGGFATPERTLVFDINDFDETLPAPFEWDLKRLAASFVIAARWRGFRPDQARDMAVGAAASYRQSMRERAATSILGSWYSKVTFDDVRAMYEKAFKGGSLIEQKSAEAQKSTAEHVFNRLTAPSKGLPRIVDQPPLLYHFGKREAGKQDIASFFKRYRDTLAEERRMLFDRYQFVDAAVKVVGVGSVGTRCYVALFLGAPDDPLFLQVKEARPSVLERYAGGGPVAHNGQRVVVGQRLLQSASDIFLGWSRGPRGRDYYVRQLRDMKAAPEVEGMTPQSMRTYAKLCGLVLAQAHDKAGNAAAIIAGYLGGIDHFDEAMGDYAVAYADQVERDYASFAKAVQSGRLKTDLSKGSLATVLR